MKIGNLIFDEQWQPIDQFGSVELNITHLDPEENIKFYKYRIVILHIVRDDEWRLFIPTDMELLSMYRIIFTDDEHYFKSDIDAICRANLFIHKLEKLKVFL